MARNEKLEQFETALHEVLCEVDRRLEECYGTQFTLHPARPEHGEIENPQYAGLFALTAKFTAGFGSLYGPGYSLEMRAVTLSHVPDAVRAEWEQLMVEHLRQRLPEVFPKRSLQIVKDTLGWKLIGDLALN